MKPSADQSAHPRRLAPQRGPPRKNNPSPSAPRNDIAPLPIDLSLDACATHDNTINEDGENAITQTMADWTLNEATNKIEESQDESDEEESYHGEIESHESSDESSVVSEQEIELPDGYAPISLDELSTSPPPSMPLVLVNLQSLCGYIPDVDEREVLISQITEALYADSSNKIDDEHEKSGEGLEFDTRVVELFESRVGSHVDTAADIVHKIKLLDDEAATRMQENKSSEDEQKGDEMSSLAIITYPEFISDSTMLQSTARLWKLLHTSHPLPVIERLFKHLRNSSQSLLWKIEMHNQIRELVVHEHKAMMSRMAAKEYEEWKTVRKEKLEKLYEVRETILLRVDVARERYEKYVEERERKVDIEMTRRRGSLWVESKKAIELESQNTTDDPFELDPYESYDDDGWGGVIKEDDIIGDSENIVVSEYCPGDDDDSESNEEWSPVGMSVVVDDTAISDECKKVIESESVEKNRLVFNTSANKLEPITSDDNAQRKSKRLEKTAARLNGHQAMSEEDAIVRAKLKTTDELVAEAMLRNLQQRLEGVDNLLECIQEEEWADEEEEEPNVNNDLDELDTDSSEMSLLDRLLAMILGGLSRTYSRTNSEEEHFRFVREEHKSIANEWLQAFGRLPQLPTSNDSEPEPGAKK